MTENGFLAEAQALRELIDEYHQRDKWCLLPNAETDGPALRKFRAYLGNVFAESQRGERLLTIGILIGREITSTKQLTIGEVFAFLTWLDDGPAGFRIRAGARKLLAVMRDQRPVRVFMRAHLSKVALRRVYAEAEPEDDATWVSPPAHETWAF